MQILSRLTLIGTAKLIFHVTANGESIAKTMTAFCPFLEVVGGEKLDTIRSYNSSHSLPPGIPTSRGHLPSLTLIESKFIPFTAK